MEIINQNNRLLVIGGTGFIGSHVVNEAIKQNFIVTILSKNEVNFFQRVKGVTYLTADVTNKSNLLVQLSNKIFNYVINLGGYIDHSSFSNGGKEIYDSHFIGLKNLIECLDIAHLNSFVQIGSSDEYGNNIAPQNESQTEDPITPYSNAKVSSTHFLQSLYQTENFPAVILRPFLVYGPGQKNNRFIPQLINGCLSNSSFPVSSGNQIRDFCYVSDIANAILIAVKNMNSFGEVINVASGKGISIKEIIEIVQNIIGSGKPIYGAIDTKPNENLQLYADISKAQKLLNWVPQIDIKEGLMKTISLTSEANKN